jgi:hypothetical protein
MDSELSKKLDAICVRHGDVTWHIEEALKAYPLISGKTKKKAKPKTEDTELQALCRETWRAYSNAYYLRYQTEPTRNAKVNSNIKQFAQRVGADSPQVASYFLCINDAWLVKRLHGVGDLLANCEAYHTQWKTGTQMTSTTARQADQTQSNFNAVQGALAMIEAEHGKT